MFWRFGLVLESRPVVVATWLKVVWMRPVSGSIRPGQRVEVGVLELGQLAPALDLGDDLVLVADLGEDAGVGREAGLAAALLGQAELLEQDLAELLRRADRELVPGELVDLALELGDALRHPLADLGEALRVELDAGALHRGEHLDQRHLDLAAAAARARTRASCARWRAASSNASRASVGRVAGRLALLGARARAAAVGGRPRRRARAAASPASAASSCELVDPPGRVDQVGGDHRVVLEVEAVRRARRPAGRCGRRRPATWRRGRSAAVPRRPLGQLDQVRRVARRPPSRRRSPAQRPAADRDRDRARRRGPPASPPPPRRPASPRPAARGRPRRTRRRGAGSPRAARTPPPRRAAGCGPGFARASLRTSIGTSMS